MTEISPEKFKELQDKIRSLPQRIIEAQEYERHRISKEIHDELGQSLATLKMLIQSSVRPEYLQTRGNRRAYDRVIHYIDEIIEKSRNIATSLRPKVIETMGLTRALKKLILDFKKNKGLNIHAQVGNLDDVQFHGEAVNLYRIVQEALANLLHHAEAANVEIMFRRNKQLLTITIKDDGKGFLPGDVHSDDGRHGQGLSTMQERARLLKGELDIQSEPGQGTVIRLQVPIIIRSEDK
ncbi:MAG TPA: sensor histidine kinase [Candidatus Omnitrophota bacterium]|nr:sensor histidine kinase [Candidatus Omnitrophota bacterium]HSA31321.1 sensor histidine kinase [Candidatus Omnitrophota bacterium]